MASMLVTAQSLHIPSAAPSESESMESGCFIESGLLSASNSDQMLFDFFAPSSSSYHRPTQALCNRLGTFASFNATGSENS